MNSNILINKGKKFLIRLLCIFVYPLASFLDWLLGTSHKSRFAKNDLKALIELHEIRKEQEKKEHNDHDHDDVFINKLIII